MWCSECGREVVSRLEEKALRIDPNLRETLVRVACPSCSETGKTEFDVDEEERS